MTEWKPTICIYHGGCMDGFTAAWAVWKRWPDIRFVGMSYGDKLPDVSFVDRVLMVDFSLRKHEMASLIARVQNVVVLDHHRTAEAELQGWAADTINMRPDRVFGVDDCGCFAFFDMNKSGARLAWEFCHGTNKIPMGVLMVEDRDLWKFNFEDATRWFHRFLCSIEQEFHEWSRHMYDEGEALKVGEYLQKDFDGNVKRMLANTHWKKVGGHKIPVVNVPYFMASDTAHQLLLAHPDAPFAAAYFVRGDGSVQYSLRSTDDRVDVSEIAKKYGGGGHRNASGFQVPA